MNIRGGTDPLADPMDGHVLTRAIIDTIREPLIVLDDQLRIITASESFYTKFGHTQQDTQGVLLYELGDGEWDIPALRTLLEQVLPANTTVEGYEVSHEVSDKGVRHMVVNAREIITPEKGRVMLLSISDVTEQNEVTRHREQLMKQKDTLLKEMRHRIANSLQLIASIILLKAGSVKSEESRLHLEDAHDRILSIATVQRNLDPTGDDSMIPVVHYLTVLSESVARSMIGGRKPITIAVTGDDSSIPPDDAISIGLITTELMLNSLKHAFPEGEGQITISFSSTGAGWKLSVGDDGVGLPAASTLNREGLGTSIVDSLASQLNASVERTSQPGHGTVISITHPATISV